MLGKDNAAEFGTPFVAGANVTAKVLGHGKEDKVIVFKYKRKKKLSSIPRTQTAFH